MARRVKYYKVTHNENHNNFLIRPESLYEENLLFVYKENGEEVKKVVPTKAIGPHLKFRKFFYRDNDSRALEFKGVAYEIPDSVIFSY
jgi:hypothetical protein